jgi:hypothetical protein
MDPRMSSPETQGGYVAVAFSCEIYFRTCTRFTRGDPSLIRRCFSTSCEDAALRRHSERILFLALGFPPTHETI